MKKLLQLFFPIVLLCSCSNAEKESIELLNCTEQSGIKICQDTLHLDLPGFVTNGAIYYDNYYLFFYDNNNRDKLGNINPDKFYRISLDGSKIKEIKYPEPYKRSFGCSFTIRNDSLIAYTQWEDETYSLNPKTLKWTKVAYTPPIIYEDNDFRVSHICHGEFGGIVSFFDKKDGNYYDGQSTCAVTVNKIDNKFYVTNYLGHMMSRSNITQIANPRKLHKRDSNPEGEWYKYLDKLNTGTELLLDSAWLTIHSSFLYQHNLYHIYSNDSTCAIGKFNSGNFEEQISLNIFPSLQHRMNNNDQFLTFFTKNNFLFDDNFDFGIMEIIDGELRIHHIKR